MDDSRSRIKIITFGVAFVFLWFMAVLLHLETLYLMATAMFLTPIVSVLIGWILVPGVACERRHPTSCGQGERIAVTLTVSNVGSLPKLFLRVRDRLPRWLYPAENQDETSLVQLLPGEAEEVTYWLEPQKRGVYALKTTQVFSSDPLGVWSFTRLVACPSELVVHPASLALRSLFWEDAGGAGRVGHDAGSQRGEGIDFHSVREYRPGDELRRVHWRTTARLGDLAVMEYEQGLSGEIALALDLSRDAYSGTGDGPESALEYAVTIIASVAQYLLQQGYQVTFLTPDRPEGPMRLQGPSDFPVLLDALARVQADSLQTLSQFLATALGPTDAPTSLFFVTPDGSEASLSVALAQWQTRGVRAAGFTLDAGSFSTGRRRSPSRMDDGLRSAEVLSNVRLTMIRRGDDLRQALEGNSHDR